MLLICSEKDFSGGDDLSGKTTLAKIMFARLLEKGEIPVYLNGRNKLGTGEILFRSIEDSFINQYGRARIDEYRQLAPEQRVLIVDEYDKLSYSPRQKRSFLDSVTSDGNSGHQTFHAASSSA